MASERGHAEAQYQLSLALMEKEKNTAMGWLRTSASNGCEDAVKKLKEIGETVPGPSAMSGIAVDKELLDYLLAYCEKGDADAMLSAAAILMSALRFGEGMKLLVSAADGGNLEAMFRLGRIYIEGPENIRDRPKGIGMWKKAADSGHALAQFYLAGLYTSMGLDDKAFRYWHMSAVNGEPMAQCFAGISLVYGVGSEKDREKGMEWLRKSAGQGYKGAADEISRILEAEQRERDSMVAYQ